jgi:hypothetical protein
VVAPRAVPRTHLLRSGSAGDVRERRAAGVLARLLRRTRRTAGTSGARACGRLLLWLPSGLRRSCAAVRVGHGHPRSGARGAPHRGRGGESSSVSGTRVGVAVRRGKRSPTRRVRRCAVAGRPLFAANMDLDWPSQPHRALWHGATLLREHRGDGHVTALAGVGLDPASHMSPRSLRAAHLRRPSSPTADGAPTTGRPPRNGSSPRGWLDSDGRLTAEGCAVRDRVEADTDRLASEPLERLGPPRVRAADRPRNSCRQPAGELRNDPLSQPHRRSRPPMTGDC